MTETDQQAGLSHLLEHMLFRGTERYASEEIDQIFDSMGAELNAGTGKETTSVYARVLDVHLERAFDVIADMVTAPAISGLAEEREVVLEEIAMYEDDPQDLVFDVLGEATFPDHALGRAILGRAEVVAEATREELLEFHHERYFPQNVVIAAAGSVDHDVLVALGRAGDAPRRRADAAPRRRRHRRRAGAPTRFPPQTPSSTTSASAAPASRAMTSGASRCACSTACRRYVLLATVPGGARAARARLLDLHLPEPLRADRAGRPLRRHARREPGRGRARDR